MVSTIVLHQAKQNFGHKARALEKKADTESGNWG